MNDLCTGEGWAGASRGSFHDGQAFAVCDWPGPDLEGHQFLYGRAPEEQNQPTGYRAPDAVTNEDRAVADAGL